MRLCAGLLLLRPAGSVGGPAAAAALPGLRNQRRRHGGSGRPACRRQDGRRDADSRGTADDDAAGTAMNAGRPWNLLAAVGVYVLLAGWVIFAAGDFGPGHFSLLI